MELHLIREEPENSGTYVETGKSFATIEEASAALEDIGAEVGRFALRVYESLRHDKMHAADKDATQKTAGPDVSGQEIPPNQSRPQPGTGAATAGDGTAAPGVAGAVQQAPQPSAHVQQTGA